MYQSIIITLLLACSLQSGLCKAEEKVITFCQGIHPPFVAENKDYKIGNDIISQAMNEIFSSIQHVKANLIIMPWESCISSIFRGKIDGVLSIFPTEERRKYIRFSTPTWLYAESIFYNVDINPDGKHWTGVDDLNGLTVGLKHGYVYPQISEKIQRRILEPYYVTSPEQNFKKLASGRIDFLVDSLLSAQYFIKKLNLKGNIRLAFVRSFDEVSIGISKKSWAIELLPKINQIIRSMKNNGTMEKIHSGNGTYRTPEQILKEGANTAIRIN